MMKSILLMFACCGIPFAGAESAVRKTVDFTVTANVGFGNEVCVCGKIPIVVAPEKLTTILSPLALTEKMPKELVIGLAAC